MWENPYIYYLIIAIIVPKPSDSREFISYLNDIVFVFRIAKWSLVFYLRPNWLVVLIS